MICAAGQVCIPGTRIPKERHSFDKPAVLGAAGQLPRHVSERQSGGLGAGGAVIHRGSSSPKTETRPGWSIESTPQGLGFDGPGQEEENDS